MQRFGERSKPATRPATSTSRSQTRRFSAPRCALSGSRRRTPSYELLSWIGISSSDLDTPRLLTRNKDSVSNILTLRATKCVDGAGPSRRYFKESGVRIQRERIESRAPYSGNRLSENPPGQRTRTDLRHHLR